jgi:hypothetical protein
MVHMSDEIKRDRSPNFPKMPLSNAVEIAAGLYKKAGKSQIRPEVVASALGYASLNGSALTTIGALNQYGLIVREKGGSISISQLALRLIHPVNDAQASAARREACLNPRVYAELFTGGFQHCAEDLIANHLIQLGFTQDGAKKASGVFKANAEFAKLDDNAIKLDSGDELSQAEQATETDAPSRPAVVLPTAQASGHASVAATLTIGKKVLATYSVPLGSNEVQISFTGEELHPEDFDALSDYVTLFKKQFVRKMESEAEDKRIEKAFNQFDSDDIAGESKAR